MKGRPHLMVSRGKFLLDAQELAAAVERHAARLSAATAGRLSSATATELRALAARIAELHGHRPPERLGNARRVADDAQRAISAIRAAARYASTDDPLLAERVSQLADDGSRSVAEVQLAFETHVGLLDAHEGQLRRLLPDDFRDRIADLRARFDRYDDARRRIRDARVEHSSALRRAEQELHRLMKEVRRVAAIVFREDRASLA